MGMGEPLANFDNVVTAMRLMLDDHAYGLSRRRVTLSTAGLVPGIDRLRDAVPGVARGLAARAERRAARRAGADQPQVPDPGTAGGVPALRRGAPRDFVMFEYVMLAGVNDSVGPGARACRAGERRAVQDQSDPVQSVSRRSSTSARRPEAIDRFRDVLMQAGLIATVRKTRGDDIDAACGQLAGQVQDRTRRVRRRQQEELAQ